MSIRPCLSLVAVLMMALVPATTFADSLGTIGSVESVTVYESGASEYGAANGLLTVKEDNANNTKRDYKWGGSLCPGYNLSTSSLGMLFDALRSQADVAITPTYKMGNMSTRCLTGFKLSYQRAPS
jgi:hypothetical protein